MSTRTKGSRGSRGRTRLVIRYFDDRVLLTDTHAWAYYRIPSVSYEFTTPEEREALATNITVALAAIRMQDAEVHLRIAHRSYPAHAWATGLDATSDGGPGWREYLEQTYQHVWSKDFWAKEIYLGVRLGQRGVRAQLSGGVISQFRGVYARGEKELGINDEAVGTTEIAKWTENAERLGRALNASALAARHASAGEIAWLIQHTLMQTAGEPLPSATKRRRWGPGEIDTEVTYDLDADGGKLRTVQISQYTGETVRTLYTDPDDLRQKWSDFDQRSAVVELFEERGIDFGVLAAQAGHPDADPFDLLCHLAFNAPLLTRKQRAERLRKEKKDFFDQYGLEARAILNELLDKYAEHGTGQFTIPDVLEVPPLSEHGNVMEIAARFGGTEQLLEAVSELQKLLYAA